MSPEKWETHITEFAAYGVQSLKTSKLIGLLANQEAALELIDPNDDLLQVVMIERLTLLLNIVCDEIDRRLPNREG